MMKKTIITVLFSILAFANSDLYAKITVENIKGEVAYKKGRQWVPLTKGQVLEEGTKISTGLKSWALINIEKSTVKVEQLTMMKIFRNKLTADSQDTLLGLKHGSLRARVSKIGTLKTSFKVTTPVATSSVRGTEERVAYGPKSGMLIQVFEGTVQGHNSKGVSNSVKGRSVFRLGINDPRPKNLLADSSSASILQLFDPNITDDERNALEFSGSDSTDLTGGQDNIIPGEAGTASVNLNIQW